eukprot:TRINITY_DN5872_c0_g1_i6.p1 TRINITY_DN5872_c0_g1~~TRINITY_DN5872_c0_g1_i6.p1  ORF type:complete len:334 (-),score=77.02 TRINITY_DN5872_c0_g1_i6:105-1106(-)
MMIAPWKGLEIFSFLERQGIKFFVFLGDSVYVDTFGTIPPLQGYHQLLNDNHHQHFIQNIPNFHMYDDHEMVDNYDEGKFSPLYSTNIDHYWFFFFGRKNFQNFGADYYFNITYGSASLFVLDTRRDRVTSLDSAQKTFLGSQQKHVLKEWLLTTAGSFKFILSPSPWSARILGNDSWSEYLVEREEIFSFIEENKIEGVVLLSGDSHFFGVYKCGNFLEYSVSPIHAIPLFSFNYHYEENQDLYHPVSGKKIEDEILLLMDLFSGYAMYIPIIEVHDDEHDPSPWYEIKVYGYSFFGAHPVEVYRNRVYLKDLKVQSRNNSARNSNLHSTEL